MDSLGCHSHPAVSPCAAKCLLPGKAQLSQHLIVRRGSRDATQCARTIAIGSFVTLKTTTITAQVHRLLHLALDDPYSKTTQLLRTSCKQFLRWILRQCTLGIASLLFCSLHLFPSTYHSQTPPLALLQASHRNPGHCQLLITHSLVRFPPLASQHSFRD